MLDSAGCQHNMTRSLITRVASTTIKSLRSRWLSRRITSGSGNIMVASPCLPVSINVHATARFEVNGSLRFKSHLGGDERIVIHVGRNSELCIGGDFVIGNGVRIFVADNAKLFVGGKGHESDSGITSLTSIMVQRSVEIGRDFMCAWGVFISDSDWHEMSGVGSQADVVIGDHVWIAHSSSILKGTRLGHDCVVASHTLVSRMSVATNSLIAGVPGRVVRTGIDWQRDILSP